MQNHNSFSVLGLRTWREQHGVSLSALAARTGLSVPHLSRLERGLRRASLGAVALLASVVPREELVSEEAPLETSQ